VPVDEIKRSLPALQRGEDPERAFLGVSSGLAPDGGAQVGTVGADGPAQQAGLREGDVIVEISDQPVRDPDDISAVVNARRPGDDVQIVVERSGERRTLTVTLGEQPEQASTSNP
jgi:S1-C subfamily serine protease